MASGPITSWQIGAETMETVRDFILGGSKITADGDHSHEIKRHLLFVRRAITNLDSILKSRDSVQLSSVVQHVWLFATPWTAARQASLSIPTPGVHPNSCPLSRWCHLIILPSVSSFSSWLQSFPASGSFPMSQLFISGGSKYWNFTFSISPFNEYSRLISFRMDFRISFRMVWSLCCPRDSQESSPTP